tara:strand:+ start:360 stop:722 length:363 start_codon:yes stop_codon:yes gene_type:complete
MNTITATDYTAEVKATAFNLVEEVIQETETRDEALELINDSRLHETIDGHQWVIYYAYNLPVLEHSDNAYYMEENLGDDCIAAALKQGGINGLHTALAYWAMYADVQEAIEERFYEIDND